MIISVVFFGFQLITPVGAMTSTVSGESKLKVSGTHMKKSLFQRKIRSMNAELKKTATAIKVAEKKIVVLKAKNRSVSVLEERIEKLRNKQKIQESVLTKLETEFALVK